MRDIKYIFFHTAAANIDNVDAAEIDKWHKATGWSGIGYNYVIIDDRHHTLKDGEVEKGRDEAPIPAQVLGANHFSLGICCVGHGDHRDFTAKQKKSLAKLIAKLCKKYDVPVKCVLGHREVNDLVAAGILASQFKTSKTCPGTKVDTDEIRGLVAAELGGTAAIKGLADAKDDVDAVKKALTVLAENSEMFGNAQEEWAIFFNNGEIRRLVA